MLRKDLVITGVRHAHLDMKANIVKGRVNEKRKRGTMKGGEDMESNVLQYYKLMFTDVYIHAFG